MLTQGFMLKLDDYVKNELDDLDTSETIDVSKLQECFLESVTEDLNNKSLKFQDILKKFFPIHEHFDVFLSHSNRDRKYVKKLQSKIEKKTSLKVFVDDGYWSHYDALVEILKEQHPDASDEEIFKHIFVIVQSALTKMIMKCNTFIYLQSPNTEDTLGTTLSPIIYHELSVSNNLLNIYKQFALTESYESKITIQYQAITSNLTEVDTVQELINELQK